MKKTILTIICLLVAATAVNAGIFATKTGYIKFYSASPLEKIEAHNHQVNAALDATSGDFVFQILMRSFEFEKAMMQEHFNENYVESDKFPNATFLGKVTNIKDVNTGKDGTYEAIIEGKLTIHGVTQTVKSNGKFEVKEGKLSGKSKFNILLSDYKIMIPGTVTNNISKSIEITVEVNLDKIN